MKENRIVVNGFAFTDRETAQKAVKEAESIKYVKGKLDMENPRMVLEMYRKLTREQVFQTPVGLVFLKQLQDYLARRPEFKMEGLEPIQAASLPKPQSPLKPSGPQGGQGLASPLKPSGPQGGQGLASLAQPSNRKGGQVPAQPNFPAKPTGQTTAQPSVAGESPFQAQPGGPKSSTGTGSIQQGASNEFGSEDMAEWYEGQIEEEKQKRRAAELKQRRAESKLKGRRGALRFSIAVNLFLLILAVGIAVITLMDSNPNIINYENKIVDKYAEWEQALEEREQAVKQREQELGL